ncbi:MAG TPA: HDOD domain-containing protein [Myxococcaceae bacterium]|nr:HDOD domain-containing protein [Myxococcaceae bacterium]
MDSIGAAIEERVRRDQIAVPPYPAVALRLGQVLRSRSASITDLLPVLKSDQALSATLLRVANSSAYWRGSAVASLNVAVSRLGLTEVHRLALAGSLSAKALLPGPLAELRRHDWIRALASAFLCERLARVRQVSPEDAFVCGLLHEFGRLVVISTLETLLVERPAEPPRTAAAWRTLVDEYHLEVGMVVAARWRLPPPVEECMLRHHDEDLGGCRYPESVRLVWAAAAVVQRLDQSPGLGAAELDAIPQLLDRDEQKAVAEVLPHLPAFIAAFDEQVSSPTAATPAVGPARVIPPPPDPQLTRDLGVELDVEPPMSVPAPAPPEPVDLTDEAVLIEEEAAPPPAPPEPPRPKILLKGNHPTLYDVMALSTTGLRIRGERALPPNLLMEYELKVEPAFHLWATVVRCEMIEGGLQDIELKPFALQGELARRWYALVRGT